MQVLLSLILFLALCPQFSLCDLECNLNSNVNSTELKISNAAASGLTINSKRNLTNLLVLDCTCEDDSKVINSIISMTLVVDYQFWFHKIRRTFAKDR